MLTWMQDYWYLCLIAFIIGLITAAWIWLWVDAEIEAPYVDVPRVDANIAVPAVPIVPVKPDIPDVKPVAFTAPVVAAAAPVVAGGPKIRAAVGAPDDLELIKGVGPKLNALLISLGVLRFDQIAAWNATEIAEVDQHLGNFKGRIERDSWVEQAGLLASGNTAAFEAKFGSLGSEIKKG
jgi:predicted flap endonuclease-1-like 5' DNA nuclease